MNKFDTVYENALFDVHNINKEVKNIKVYSALIEKKIDNKIVNESIFNGESIKKYFLSLFENIKSGLLKSLTSFDVFKSFIKKTMETGFVKKMCDTLFGDSFKNSDNIVKEQQTITLTQEQFQQLVIIAQENAKKPKEGKFGKICGWIVDHFWGIIQILSVITVAYFVIFQQEYVIDKFRQFILWVKNLIVNDASEEIAQNMSNEEELMKIASQAQTTPEFDDVVKNGVENTIAGTVKGANASLSLINNSNEQIDAMTEEMKSSFTRFLYSDAMKIMNKQKRMNAITEEWRKQLVRLWKEMKDSGVDVPSINKMPQWVRDNKPELWKEYENARTAFNHDVYKQL